jgi:glycosyltransferase involved in cell wall biosynthesis
MISFIIIGLNEGWKLSQSVNSIYEAVANMDISTEYEIIYVDSNSNDDSIQRMQLHKNVSIYKLTKFCNPPVARNLGASKASGDVFVFLDGDMTIDVDFLNVAFDTNTRKMKHPLIGGTAIDRIIKPNGEKITDIVYHKQDAPYFKPITGGAFMIDSHLWREVGGMDIRFNRGADPELGLRLAGKGVLLLSFPELFIIHHNDKYRPGNRQNIARINKNVLFSSMLMYRKNVLNKYALKRLLSHEKSLIAFALSTALLFVFQLPYVFLLYFVVLCARSLKRSSLKESAERVLYYFSRDVLSFFGNFFYWPKKQKLEHIPFVKLS